MQFPTRFQGEYESLDDSSIFLIEKI